MFEVSIHIKKHDTLPYLMLLYTNRPTLRKNLDNLRYVFIYKTLDTLRYTTFIEFLKLVEKGGIFI